MKRIIIANLIVMLLICAKSYGGFVGPSEILSTTYGTGNGQVGLREGDSGDEFPWKVAVSAASRIALCDEANDRVVIYKADGTFERSIDILSTGVVFDSSDALYLKAKFRKFNKDGTVAFVKDAGYQEIFAATDKIIGYDREKKNMIFTPPPVISSRPLQRGPWSWGG